MFEYGLIVAGGEGKRLRPLTDTIPKPLLPVGEKPIIESIIEGMHRQGVNTLFISVNYKKELIRNYLRDGSRLGVRVSYLEERLPTGTAGCLSLLPSSFSAPLLMSNGDLVSDVDYRRIFEMLADFDLVITAVARHFLVDFGVLHCNGNSELESWEEKPRVSYLVNGGIYGLSADLVHFVRSRGRGERSFDMPDLWRLMKENGKRIGVYRHEGKWIDIGRIADYQNVTEQEHG